MPPRPRSRPEIIAHRGTPRELPENTLPAFRRALAVGADAIELDVHATRDGIVVVHHDAIPRAIAPDAALAGRPIATLAYDELRGFSVAGSAPIPTLDEVLEEVDGRATVYVEVKGRGAERPSVGLLAGREAWTAVHSFDHRVARWVTESSPALRTGVLLDCYLIDSAAAMRAATARDLWQQWEFIDAELVRDVHAGGGRLIAWTVNEPEAARRLAALGVDGLCTDLPLELRQALDAPDSRR
jgi:glycerophosphoryl diester phosphodiesterase